MTDRRTNYFWRALLVLVSFGGSSALAHEGPPFPLLMDEPLSGHVISVWADPDIGEARFFIVIESPDGGVPATAPKVSLWTEPSSGRLERVSYPTELQTLRNRLQFEVHPNFDTRDMWRIGVEMTLPGGQPQTITTEVESTPPGFGAWDLVIYLFPFVLFGGMWTVSMVRRHKAWRNTLPDTSSSSARPLSNLANAPMQMGRHR